MGAKKRGRPVKDEPRTIKFDVRMTLPEWEHLTDMAEQTGLSKADIIRRALTLYGDYLDY